MHGLTTQQTTEVNQLLMDGNRRGAAMAILHLKRIATKNGWVQPPGWDRMTIRTRLNLLQGLPEGYRPDRIVGSPAERATVVFLDKRRLNL